MKLNCAFFDTDHLIEQQQGMTVAEIFSAHGEQRFRELERELLDQLARENPVQSAWTIYATGGGLPVYNNNLQRLNGLGKVIALDADLTTLVNRVKSNWARPLLAAAENAHADNELRTRLSELLAQRAAVYAQAGYKIDTSGLDPQQVADEIIRILYAG